MANIWSFDNLINRVDDHPDASLRLTLRTNSSCSLVALPLGFFTSITQNWPVGEHAMRSEVLYRRMVAGYNCHIE
jgi:hypothetical protein